MTTDAEIDAMIAKCTTEAEWRDNAVLYEAADMLTALKAERTQPVKTLREVREQGHTMAWIWTNLRGKNWYSAMILGDELHFSIFTQPLLNDFDRCPAVPIIPPQPLEK